MSLTALAHVMHRTAAPAANTVEGWLNAIFAALDGGMTYWDVERYQLSTVTQALYFTPKAGGAAAAKNVRIMLAGADSGSLTPTMGLNSTFDNAKLYMSLTIGGGAFNAWDDSDPFTSHNHHSGLLPVGATASLTIDFFDFYESAETIQFVPVGTDGAAKGGGQAGALIDPESDVAGNGSPTADSRVYAIWTAGDAQPYSGIYQFGQSTGQPGTHSTPAGFAKAVFLANSGTWTAMVGQPPVPTSNSTLVQADGSPWLVPLYWYHAATPYRVLGRWREVMGGPKITHNTDIDNAQGARVAYGIAYDDGTAYASLCALV